MLDLAVNLLLATFFVAGMIALAVVLACTYQGSE